MDLHKSLLEILSEFDRFCGERDIRYSLHGGTLLGAIREHGFIPWDDDADVTMTRREFQRLDAAIKDSAMPYLIRGNIKKQFCKEETEDVWVDIFICDYISENKVCQKLKQALLTVLDIMHRDEESMKLSNLKSYSIIKQLIYRLIFALGQIIPKNWTAKWYTQISESWFLGHRKCMFRSNDQYIGRMLCFPAEWMERMQGCNFCEKEFLVTTAYHGLLQQCYGTEYMTPLRDERNMEVHKLVRTASEMNL